MKNLSINFYRYLTLSIVWGGVIVYLLIIYSPKFGLPTSFPFLDKVVHFILFFIQSIFITNTIYEYRNRNNLTVLRNLEYENNQVTAGQKLMSIKITADYAISKNITSLFFYDHNFSKFAISTAFPQTSIRSGITIRYNFGN